MTSVLTTDNKAKPLPMFINNGSASNFPAVPVTVTTNLIPNTLYNVRDSVPLSDL